MEMPGRAQGASSPDQSECAEATLASRTQCSVPDGDRFAHATEEEATYMTSVPWIACGSSKDACENSPLDSERATQPERPEVLRVRTMGRSTMAAADAPGLCATRNSDVDFCRDVTGCAAVCGDTAAEVNWLEAFSGKANPVLEAGAPSDKKATCCEDEKAEEQAEKGPPQNLPQPQRSEAQDNARDEYSDGEVGRRRVGCTLVQEGQEVSPVVVIGPHTSETERADSKRETRSCNRTVCLAATTPADVAATVGRDEFGGHDGDESQEECLRRVLCELDRTALESMQERMQRSVCFLLETRKEKEAEQLGLLRERRQLDAMLAEAQRQLIHCFAPTATSGAEAVIASSPAKHRKPSSTSACLEAAIASGSNSRLTASVSQLELRTCSTKVCEESDSAGTERTVASPPLQRGTDSPGPARFSQRDLAAYYGTMAQDADEDEGDNVVADFLGDLLHKYGPAAVKGVGAAANMVKVGWGVLRQELLDLQQHQQATERQRAIETHARYMLRRDEELERLRHQHLMQQLQYQFVSAGERRRPSHPRAPSVRTPAAAAETADAEQARMLVLSAEDTASSTPQGIKQHNEAECASAASKGNKILCRAPEYADKGAAVKNLARDAAQSPTARQSPPASYGSRNTCLRAEGSTEQLCKGPMVQARQLQKGAKNAARAAPARYPPPLHLPATATVHTSSEKATAPSTCRGYKGIGARSTRAESDIREPRATASAEAAISLSWRDLLAVEGKSSPPARRFGDFGRDVEKALSNSEPFVPLHERSATNAQSSLRGGGEVEKLLVGVPSTKTSVHACGWSPPPLSPQLPSPYKTLGTRKERLQKTAASLDSLSRGVADAMGSVRHTLSRWFTAPSESSAVDSETCVQTYVGRSDGAGEFNEVDCVSDGRASAAEPKSLDVRGSESCTENAGSVLLGSHAALGTVPAAKMSCRNRSHSETPFSANGGLTAQKTVVAPSSLEVASAPEESTRQSSVVSAQVAHGDGIDSLTLLDGTPSQTGKETCSSKTAAEEHYGATLRREQDIVETSESGDRKARRPFPHVRNSVAEELVPGDEAGAAASTRRSGRHYSTTVSELCATESLVGDARVETSAATAEAEHAEGYKHVALTNDCGEGGEGPPIQADGKDTRDAGDCGSGHKEAKTNGQEYLAAGEDPPVIEATINVGGKSGVVPLQLVVLATEQCIDVAEEWVDRHWVQLQQTHFWLMRGKAGASETPAEAGAIVAAAAGNGSCGPNAGGKRSKEAQTGELEDEEKWAVGRQPCGNGAAKATFLTRSRAIHCLAAFLGHAEATSENLPVRVVEDWGNIITPPSVETARDLRQHTRQRNSEEACDRRK